MRTSPLSDHLAGEVRAELARRQRTATGLAAALQVSPAYLYKRLSGDVPFDAVEIFRIATELDVSAQELFARAERRADRPVAKLERVV